MTEYIQTKLGIENTLRTKSKIRQLTPEQLGIPDIENPDRTKEDRWGSLHESAEEVAGESEVGVAVRLEDDSVATGTSLSGGTSRDVHPLELAIWKGYEQGSESVVDVAVFTSSKDGVPCGRCLQVLADYSGEHNPSIQISGDGEVEQYTLLGLLPES